MKKIVKQLFSRNSSKSNSSAASLQTPQAMAEEAREFGGDHLTAVQPK